MLTTGTTIAVLAVVATSEPALAGSSAAEGPRFARSYVGTATGTLRVPGRTETWTVRGLTFRLQSARLARGRWGGTYLVTGGTVSFTSTATGGCSSMTSGSFPLGRLTWEAASISFLQNLGEPGYAYQARVSKQHPVTVTVECTDDYGTSATRQPVSPAGGNWLHTDIGERFEPGRRLSGSYTVRDERGTTTWSWNLAPRG